MILYKRRCVKRTREATLYKGAARRSGAIPEEILERERLLIEKEEEVQKMKSELLRERFWFMERKRVEEENLERMRQELAEWQEDLQEEDAEMEDRELRHEGLFPEE